MSIPMKISDQQLTEWQRLKRPSDVGHIARELKCTRALIYDAFYRRQTSERVYEALRKFYAARERRIEQQLRRADILLDNYENQQR
jgi:hypothetical protein